VDFALGRRDASSQENAQKSGDSVRIDIRLSFEKGTKVEEVVELQTQMQEELNEQIGDCVVNVIMCDK
jgi:divalent metal cation (Fe/Co/Zn/Cd) transporter